MKPRLFITTSNGVYMLDPGTGDSQCVLSNRHTPGFFSRKARGYFGICRRSNGRILVSSREKLGLRKYNKPTTDTRLFEINPATNTHELVATVRDVHDAHQIDCLDNNVFITDTGKNRVVVHNLEKQKVETLLNVGRVRDDIHHLNAVLVHDHSLLIGLNNRSAESSILEISLEDINPTLHRGEFDVLDIGEVKPINGVTHSHDIEYCRPRLLCCSSSEGRVIDVASTKTLIKEDDWVRGLATDESSIWVGASFVATRKQRHAGTLDGRIHQYRLPDLELTATHILKGSGQINDMILA